MNEWCQNLPELIRMGKYGCYVWSAYGIAIFVMAYTAIKPLLDKKHLFKELLMKYRREEKS